MFANGEKVIGLLSQEKALGLELPPSFISLFSTILKETACLELLVVSVLITLPCAQWVNMKRKQRTTNVRTGASTGQHLSKLLDHDLTVDAAWPELFVDHKGKYWKVPESISLDLSSLTSGAGFLYRFGVHKNRVKPQVAVNTVEREVPAALSL